VCCSYNADMLPDLLVENMKTPGSWTIYIANVTEGFVPMAPLPRSQLTVPHSSAFINLLEDYAAGTCSWLFSIPALICSKYYCFYVAGVDLAFSETGIIKN